MFILQSIFHFQFQLARKKETVCFRHDLINNIQQHQHFFKHTIHCVVRSSFEGFEFIRTRAKKVFIAFIIANFIKRFLLARRRRSKGPGEIYDDTVGRNDYIKLLSLMKCKNK